MKKFLLGLLICVCANAQVSDVDMIRNLKSELMSGKSKDSEELQKVLEKYFNDGCKVIVNSEEIVLKRERFPQYAKIGAMFIPKKDRDLEILKDILDKNLKNEPKKISTYLKISEKRKININFTLNNEKISEINCKDVPLNFKQRLMLKGIFNLLRGADKS
jgi:hypothetical protein